MDVKQQFARDTYKAVRNILYKKYKTDNDNLARYMTAQIMGESGWGQKPSGTFNYFGIKAKSGEPYTEVLTTEYINGQKKKMMQRFKNYKNLEDGMEGYIDLLVNNYDILNHGDSIQRYGTQLKSKGYATDPNYATRIADIYNGRTFRSALDGYTINPGNPASLGNYSPFLSNVPEKIKIPRFPLKRLGGILISRKFINNLKMAM